MIEASAPRRARRGWRPLADRPFPTLGWLVLDWTYDFLPSPANDKEPLVYTDEQASRILEWFRLDPKTGRFAYNRRLHLQEAKGFGKSPFAASLDIIDFAGPVCFDGWDADGQPVGVPWGTGDRPPPWIQIAAVSEGQTRNTWAALYAMLMANGGRAADLLRIDAGLTRCYLADEPEAILEPVTASSGSREGQRVTKATLDEPQLWTPASGGHRLADTILGNLTKMNGRAVFTGNAYVKGEESVAERFDVDERGVLRYSRRPSQEPSRDMPREKLIELLEEVYGDADWVDPDRIVDDATSTTANWDRSKRLFWNLPGSGTINRWIPGGLWDDAAGDPAFDPKLPAYACVVIAHDHRSAAIALAQRQGPMTNLRCRMFRAGDPSSEFVPVADLETYIRGLHERYPAFVVGLRRTPGGRERTVSVRGPEILYNGAFFEGSAQRLAAEGLQMTDWPWTPARYTPAAETLKGAVLEGKIRHDGDAELSSQIGAVQAEESGQGYSIIEAEPAARASMIAVHRALNAPVGPSRALRHAAPR